MRKSRGGEFRIGRGERKKMLSRDCDGCSQLKPCGKRYRQVQKGDKVYCSDGTAHLVDNGSVEQNTDLHEKYYELLH